MYKAMRVGVVVPAHNESAHIAKVLTTLPDLVDHVVVVDDASDDDTAEVARSVADPRVHVIRNAKNLGVGGAIIAGHRRLLELGSDVNVVMAGDAQMDPAFLPDLLDPIAEEGYGFTKANRFYSMSSFSGMPRHRVFGNIVLSFASKVSTGYWYIFDPQNGYTAIRRSDLERVPLEQVSEGYQFENDLLIHLNILRVRVKDVPVPAVYGTEVSGIRLRKVVPSLVNLLVFGFWRRIFWKYVLWTFSPVALLLFSGLFLFLFGLGFGMWVLAEALGNRVPTAGTVMLSVAPGLLGVQLLLAALVLDILESPR